MAGDAKMTTIPIDDIASDDGNARRRDKKGEEAIKASLERFGPGRSIVIDGDNTIRAGNGTTAEAKKLGFKRIIVVEPGPDELVAVRRPEWTEEEARGYGVADNKASDLSFFDDSALAALLKSVPSVDPGAMGFGKGELASLLARVNKQEAKQDKVPEPPKVAVTKPGDVWILGRHRLVCGDSTDRVVVHKIARSKSALFATDPPYGVAYGVETPHGEAIKNDENDGPKLQSFLEAVFAACLPRLNDNAAWYLWHAQMTQGYFAAAAAAAEVLIHRQIVWVKPSLIMGHGDFHWKHELCFYGWVKGNRPPWYSDRKQTTVWEVGRENDGIHPTQKPVELFTRPLGFNTKPGDSCLDPFLGSGTSLIAAEQLDRICYGIEIEPRYCDVVIERWENLTSAKARRITGKQVG